MVKRVSILALLLAGCVATPKVPVRGPVVVATPRRPAPAVARFAGGAMAGESSIPAPVLVLEKIWGLLGIVDPQSIPFTITPQLSAPAQIRLQWEPSPSLEVTGYYLCWANESGLTANNKVEVGPVTNATVCGMAPRTTFFFTVAAHDSFGQVSAPSNEVRYDTINPALTKTENGNWRLDFDVPPGAYWKIQTRTDLMNEWVDASPPLPSVIPPRAWELQGGGDQRFWRVVILDTPPL